MAEDLQENLNTYKNQLQQVEASLTTDPDNEDLQKLRNDLQEVIDLTVDLISGQLAAATAEASGSTGGEAESASLPSLHWSVGDKCLAPFSEDGQYYEGVVEEILDNGSCTITFSNYGNTDITQVSLLKPVESSGAGGSRSDDKNKNKSKKDLIAEQREYKRKKSQKKAQRLQKLEEEREQEKNKWLTFNAKTFSKTNKGRVKKSIFATSDITKGKVGVGTCGVSGKPMTAYKGGEKWRK
ncbi:hypothetical protein LOTGIDRAFT_235650 [Lottia gigantea]|uniref:Survival of motor neuron-related-splicing factor 30 n=1 Tax=Lottia gigantea TaxID=225164 RepID=V3ZYL2_LOTGI|nr:hypothetical protein LOTGIDRAFT_235650 [Lottia gigantea]ESO86076.1 hypothetical protein LOTGIDRAFT_235650 [Lottia gigantea]